MSFFLLLCTYFCSRLYNMSTWFGKRYLGGKNILLIDTSLYFTFGLLYTCRCPLTSRSSSSLPIPSSLLVTVIEMALICLTRSFALIWFWWTILYNREPTHLARSAFLMCQSRLRQAGSVKPGCVGLSDAWSIKIHVGYTTQAGASLFHQFGCWDHVDLYLFCCWNLQELVVFSLVLPFWPYHNQWP